MPSTLNIKGAEILVQTFITSLTRQLKLSLLWPAHQDDSSTYIPKFSHITNILHTLHSGCLSSVIFNGSHSVSHSVLLLCKSQISIVPKAQLAHSVPLTLYETSIQINRAFCTSAHTQKLHPSHTHMIINLTSKHFLEQRFEIEDLL